MKLQIQLLSLALVGGVVAAQTHLSADRILMAYMDCAQPGPTPGCAYHPYYNTITTANTTMDMKQQLQISAGKAYGMGSASAYDPAGEILYFFQGDENTLYRIDVNAHKLLPRVTFSTEGIGPSFMGINAVVWNNHTDSLVAVIDVGSGCGGICERLIEINPESGAVKALDESVDPTKRVDYAVGGGLIATDGKILVLPRGCGGKRPVDTLSVVNMKTGVAQLVATKPPMRIYGLEHDNGIFWAVGTVCPNRGCPTCMCPDNGESLIAQIDPVTGTVTPLLTADIKKFYGFNMQLGRSTFDHKNGVLYFTCDPDVVGVSVLTGKVLTKSPLVHWADGTQDSEFVLAMQFMG